MEAFPEQQQHQQPRQEDLQQAQPTQHGHTMDSKTNGNQNIELNNCYKDGILVRSYVSPCVRVCLCVCVCVCVCV